ncbi:hypothetical protein [Paenibacillus rhizophilus]|uniref:Uncharacterized protein n=1 Tax=Paenibacillus rhizophilus TaxID=1850366 RepID=A0A3N9P612_9BACL|nr:hypothetical protein [Paenibacillus rhizophilus]RQW10524.1 hypothetical protein EH198_14725 [Paenibacillus rhizophilus]
MPGARPAATSRSEQHGAVKPPSDRRAKRRSSSLAASPASAFAKRTGWGWTSPYATLSEAAVRLKPRRRPQAGCREPQSR